MPANNNSYEKIQSKIHAMKTAYPSLRTKSDDYVFSALCIKSHLYKNPALVLYESDFDEMIVDGQYDGGVDVLVTDPNSDGADMVIAQSKYYTSISTDDVMNAIWNIKLSLLVYTIQSIKTGFVQKDCSCSSLCFRQDLPVQATYTIEHFRRVCVIL